MPPCKEIIEALLEGTIKEYIQTTKEKISEGAIYSYVHRCRKRFRYLLKKEGLEL